MAIGIWASPCPSPRSSRTGVLTLVERKDLDERRAGVERLIVGDGAGHFPGRRIAELRGLGEGVERREDVGLQASEQAQHRPDDDVTEVDEQRNIQNLNFEHVARLRAFDADRPREGVGLADVEGENAVRRRRSRGCPDVEGIPA
jgi:hypothetical protein